DRSPSAMADDKTSKESKSKVKKGSGSSNDSKVDASDGGKGRGSRKKQSVSKRTSRSGSLKKTNSAGTPVGAHAESPKREAAAPQTTVKREARHKASTLRGSKSGKPEEKKKGPGIEYNKKMTQAEYDKWCEVEGEMWTPCKFFKEIPKRKFVAPCGRLFKVGEDVSVLPSPAHLAELQERTRRSASKSVKTKTKKKLRKVKSSVEDKFSRKMD
ncbi:hypothetical protein PENTCL1PPCAC_12227, partial [Pristionchus entomophagus]